MTEYEYNVPNFGYRMLGYGAVYTGYVIGIVGGILSNGHLLPIILGGISVLAGKGLYEIVNHEKLKDPAKQSGLERRMVKNQKRGVHPKRKIRRPHSQSNPLRKKPSHPPKQGRT